jgi:hypothetical protein
MFTMGCVYHQLDNVLRSGLKEVLRCQKVADIPEPSSPALSGSAFSPMAGNILLSLVEGVKIMPHLGHPANHISRSI